METIRVNLTKNRDRQEGVYLAVEAGQKLPGEEEAEAIEREQCLLELADMGITVADCVCHSTGEPIAPERVLFLAKTGVMKGEFYSVKAAKDIVKPHLGILVGDERELCVTNRLPQFSTSDVEVDEEEEIVEVVERPRKKKSEEPQDKSDDLQEKE